MSEALADWDDPRTQTVYEILCDPDEPPNPEEHWEGWKARRIVAAVASWQPIETAPKDGGTILLWFPWTGRRSPAAPAGFTYLAKWCFSDDEKPDRWIEPYDAEDIGDGATHWQPLPAPPAEAKSEVGG